jgi:N-acetyl-anhydromuramyl-L-alanine amidase AmpD
MDGRGWNAIAYNWLVDEAGVIYEGRGAGVVGGATRGWNSRTESICFTQWGGETVPEAAKVSIRWLVDDISQRYGGGLWVKAHRDFASTSCPGDALYRFVEAGCEPSVGDPSRIDWDAIGAFVSALRASVASKPLSRRRRSRGVPVRAAQGRLRDRGFDPGPVDGVYGKKTRDAVKAFQRSVGVLKADGVIGVRTWDALFIM